MPSCFFKVASNTFINMISPSDLPSIDQFVYFLFLLLIGIILVPVLMSLSIDAWKRRALPTFWDYTFQKPYKRYATILLIELFFAAYFIGIFILWYGFDTITNSIGRIFYAILVIPIYYIVITYVIYYVFARGVAIPTYMRATFFINPICMIVISLLSIFLLDDLRVAFYRIF